MPYPSDPRLLVLHGLRLKGVADVAALAEATGLDGDRVAGELAALADEGLAVERTGALAGWALTPAGPGRAPAARSATRSTRRAPGPRSPAPTSGSGR